jgi:ketosteroid isomerase-like protein
MDNVAEEIILMEKAALTRWGNGDPAGFLEITAPDVVYFDPYIPCRIDGVRALHDYYRKNLWGKVHVDRFELVNPVVQVMGEAAVLTFNYVSYQGDQPDRWNCTEVYRRSQDGWKIIQSHWSYTRVFKNKDLEFKK